MSSATAAGSSAPLAAGSSAPLPVATQDATWQPPFDVALARLGIDALERAEWLPWLLLLAVLGIAWSLRRAPRAAAWPGWVEARHAGGRAFEWTPPLAGVLRLAALAALALALAAPTAVHRAPPEPGLGLDLVLVLDTSGSMRALDTVVDGSARTRLDLAREVVARFASGRVAEGDRVGLVVFGDSAFTHCPLTSDGSLLRAALDRVEVGMAGDATALGDALALSVKRAVGGGSGGSGHRVVLLTDGRSNAGAVPIDVAAELARGAGVRVHTVGIGTGGEEVPMAGRSPGAADGVRFERHDPDLETLREVAELTGGRAFRARRSGDLQEVYADIDALERRPRPLPPRMRRAPRAEPALAIAGGALLLELALARIIRRRVP